MDESAKDIPGVIAPPPLIFGVPLVAGLAFHELVGGLDIPLEWLPWIVRAPAGALFCIAGATFIVLALIRFSAVDTPPEPWEETTALVTSGVYRVTRNPMYLGMAMIFAGLGLLAGCWLVLGLLVPVIWTVDRHVIEREEAYLTRKFGPPYEDYITRSRRWI